MYRDCSFTQELDIGLVSGMIQDAIKENALFVAIRIGRFFAFNNSSEYLVGL